MYVKFACFVLTLLVAATSFVIVDHTEFAVVERLGQVQTAYNSEDAAGWHWKLPWPIETVRRFDARVQLFEPAGYEVVTADGRNVIVEAFVCWKIPEQPSLSVSAPVLDFYQSSGSVVLATDRLGDQLRSVVANELGAIRFGELLPSESTREESKPLQPGTLESLSDSIERQLKTDAENGIEIVDVQIRRFGFPAEHQQAILQRMRAEQLSLAEQHRAAGRAESDRIRADSERLAEEIVVRARANADRVRAEAEAQAVAMLNDVHDRDPEFYELLRTLESYRTILGERTSLVLSTSSRLFHRLVEGVPETNDLPIPRAVDATGETRTDVVPTEDAAEEAQP